MKTRGYGVRVIGWGFAIMLLGCHKEQSELGASGAPANSGPAVDEGRLPAAGPPMPGPTIVQVEPIDMATSIGTTPIQLIVSNSGGPVGQATLTQIAAAVSLKTYPEMGDVPLAISNIVDTTGQPGQDAYAHIYLSPKSPLADRWYGLSVGALPSTVNWPPFPSMLALAGGANMARFRPGSDPMVAGVRSYAKAGGVSIAYVDFSERVTGAVNAIQLAYADGAATSCVADDPAAPTPIADTPNAGVTSGKAQAATSFSTLSFNCGAAIDYGRPIVLSIAQGLKSTSGAALNRGAAAQHTIAPADWTSWAGGGKLWRGSPLP